MAVLSILSLCLLCKLHRPWVQNSAIFHGSCQNTPWGKCGQFFVINGCSWHLIVVFVVHIASPLNTQLLPFVLVSVFSLRGINADTLKCLSIVIVLTVFCSWFLVTFDFHRVPCYALCLRQCLNTPWTKCRHRSVMTGCVKQPFVFLVG